MTIRHAIALRVALALIYLVATATSAANPQVDLETTRGLIRLELYPQAAPKTVENFLAYVESGHFDNVMFHRVVPGNVIQAGVFTHDFKYRSPRRPPIMNEAAQSLEAGLSNVRGYVAMARMADPHSASTQFFINLSDNKSLDFREPTPEGYGYAVFGKVIWGLGVADTISKSTPLVGETFSKGLPEKPVLIKSARVVVSSELQRDPTNDSQQQPSASVPKEIEDLEKLYQESCSTGVPQALQQGCQQARDVLQRAGRMKP